jgi:hypothetical protein
VDSLYGSYVYLLLCRDPGGQDQQIFARFGCADAPVTNIKRLAQFPAKPWALATAHIWSRSMADHLREELYSATRRWHFERGWLSLRHYDCRAFRLVWTAIFVGASTSSWRLRWTPVKLTESQLFANVWIDPSDQALA